MYFSRPFPMQRRSSKFNDPTFRLYGSPLRLWGYARFSSVPQQISASVATFDIAKQFGDVKINELVQSVEVLAGVEYRIAADVLGRDLFDLSGKSRTAVSLIAGYGAVTPVNPKQVASIFETPDPSSNTYKQFSTLYPDAAVLNPDKTAKYKAIAFVGRDRDRFFREYYGGLRFETRYFDNGYRRITRPPHTLDIMLGQNETVTRGRTQGLVFRLDFFYSLPYEKASFIYLYATGTRRAFTQARETDTLPLQPSNVMSPCPSGQTCRSLYSPDTFVAPLPASNRDYYRVGIGLDFVQMFKSIKQKAPNAAGGTADPAAQPPAVAPPK